jgi:uncharacterized Zn-binding protein involved in type VI secretion
MSVAMSALRQTVESSLSATRATLAETAAASIDEKAPPPNPARKVQQIAGAIMGIMAMPTELGNTGIALATNKFMDVLGIPMPSFPAAFLGSLYVGAPHAHAHPPSLVPPAPPVPLPSMGAITLGTSVKVLVGGMPAARVGDLGMAPTCGGLAPFFTVKLGSSKVFIGGARAARMTDMCTACTKDEGRSVGLLDVGMAAVGMVADLTDAATATSAAMAGAQALSAAMAAAQLAADAIAMALSETMGTDPAIPPALPGFVMLGMPTVLVAGLPVPSTQEIAKWLKNKLKGLLAALKKAASKKGASVGGGGGCSG